MGDLLDTGHRLAVVRAPVGFGKSVLLSHWRDRKEADGEQVLLVEAEGTGPASEILWSPIGSVLGVHSAESGGHPNGSRRMTSGTQMHPSPEAGWFAALAGHFGELDQPLTLVVDRFEHVTDARVLRDFADLVHRCALLRVVIAGRALAGFDDLPASLVPTTVITEADLAFTEAETALVLSSADPLLAEADAAALHHELRGWPLAIGELALSVAPTPGRPDLSSALTVAVARVCKDLAEAVGVDESDLGCLATTKELNLDTATLLLSSEWQRGCPVGRRA